MKRHYNLRVSKQKLTETIKEQINKGMKLIDQTVKLLANQPIDSGILNDQKQYYLDWDDYNSEVLKQAFNIPNNEYKIEYDNVTLIQSDEMPLTLVEQADVLINQIHLKIKNLVKLRDKIPLFSDLPEN